MRGEFSPSPEQMGLPKEADKAEKTESASEKESDAVTASQERVASVGSQLHEIWRGPRWREETKDYEPRIKKTKDQAWSESHGGATEVDIANTAYEELPSDWQGENKISAEVAVNEVERAMEAGEQLDEAFVEAASSVLHDRWLERNGSWASPEQKVPYQQLSEEEKEKDRVIIRKAIEACKKKE